MSSHKLFYKDYKKPFLIPDYTVRLKKIKNINLVSLLDSKLEWAFSMAEKEKKASIGLQL